MPSPAFDTAFATALYDIAVEEGNTQTIEALRNKALQKISDGLGHAVIATAVNGKSVSFSISKPADQLFAEASYAIKKFNVGIITSTSFDFTLLF